MALSHIIVGLSSVVGMFVINFIKNKLLPEKSVATPPVIVNITITSVDPNSVKVSTDNPDVQLLKG